MAVDSFRSAFHFNRVEADEIGFLISAQSYRPEITKAIRKIKNWDNWKKLQDICVNTISPGPHPKYSSSGHPCLKTRNVLGLIASNEEIDWVSPTQAATLKRFFVKNENILLNLTGAGSIGRVSIYFGNSQPLTNQHIARIEIDKSYDSSYICSFLSSWWGERAIEQGISGTTGQLNLVNDHVRSLPIPIPDRAVQNYIGDKVRLAEKLRERSKELEQEAKKIFENELLWEQQLETKKIHGRVEVKDLEQRLDINFNSPNRLSLLQHLRKNNINTEPLANLVEISAMIGWKGLTTEHYTDEGPWLLRGVEFSNGIIDFDSLVSIKKYKYDEQPQIHLKEGDIAFTKDGTIGKAIVIPSLSNDLAAGSTVARLRCYSDEKINRYYLEYVLNHPVMQIQIMSFATGMAQPHITQEWIAKLQIPRCQFEEKIGHEIKFYHECLIESEKLTTAAKFLVEALIEGKLTETELTNAQTALQKGEIEPDKAILAKLTRQGYEIPDQPILFPDLDAFYEVIKEINLTSDS
ncbi:MAG: restriction endonuclease subunit S [Xenococcus sp. MO_188.B8]|nr:restriction endonuclease subunit S [Xenococcus sp. MO_188.B8]